jgi:hypothetical protein
MHVAYSYRGIVMDMKESYSGLFQCMDTLTKPEETSSRSASLQASIQTRHPPTMKLDLYM